MQKDNMQKDNVQRPYKGLNRDNAFYDTPEGTYRFALNTVNETELGDLNFIGNEESNELCVSLPDGFIPIGKVYLGDNEIAIFSVTQDGISEIGIINSNTCTYTTHVNDALTPEDRKLNFSVAKQIKATYRLRRGCERTVYWVDGINKPRQYNFDKPENFETAGDWDANKFELIRSYQSIPEFDNIEVLNSGGNLEPGSYNVAIQYLDEDLNPTEWITTSPIIYVYNDDTDEKFLDIRGSINSDTDYIDFSTTDKAIRVDIGSLDDSFLFYRLAFIEATAGTGLVTSVKYTDTIPITKNFFIYTGSNFSEEGTEEEIAAFTNIIDTADSIEQIENRLILANIKGKQVNFCKLQKYASRIRADVILKPVIVNQMVNGSPKNPTVNFEAAGYMPGEIYSFGIVYVFKDGSTSPVYHIPGKNTALDPSMVFVPQFNGDNEPVTFGMSINNESENNLYTDNSNCGIEDYWGVDSEGQPLLYQPVRHHRFPLRSTIGKPLVEEIDSIASENIFFQIVFTGQGTIDICTQEMIDNGECSTLSEPFQARVEYTVDGVVPGSLTVNINPTKESNPFSFEERSEFLTSNNIVITGIFESTAPTTDITGTTSPKNMNYTATFEEAQFSTEERLYRTEVYGIQFSGIDIPTVDDTNGEEIIGYYIVRNERTESEKTILDTAAMFPCVTNNKYISHGLLGPELSDNSRLHKKVFSFVNPEFKFNNLKYNEFTDIIQEGQFDIIDRKKSKSRYRDVQEGTSYDPSVHKSGGGTDEDGWSLKCITRDNITAFKKVYTFNKLGSEIKNTFYLAALESRDTNENNNTIYNIAGDNQVGIFELEDDYTEDLRDKIPYLYFRRDIADSYSTFRTLPFYKASNNITDRNIDVTSVFGGDTFITPMRYVNSVFWDNRIAERAGKTSAWNYIIGGILIVIGAVLTFFTGGTSTFIIAAGVAIIGGGALFISSGIKRDALVRAYNDEYEKGLRETALDQWTDLEYKNMMGTYEGGIRSADTPEDDEIQWIGDCITDLWFESKVNTLLRNGFSVDTPTFIDAPGIVEDGNDYIEPIYEHFSVYKIRDEYIAPATVLDKHMMAKLSAFDPSRGDSRLYIGHPLGEYYQINPDYNRLNSQKIYYHLGIEYDCCSDCQEEFPHRVHYSEQSFQEELTDNYRVFLPNNYRDIEGEKGVITNLYRFYNNLYIHTEEALWHLPQNYQERTTNDIVSFIGTGSYFETPPRRIVDDSNSSAGTIHSHGVIKTKHGILFPAQIENKWYLFDGNKLKALSDYGISNWFKENMNSVVAEQYFLSNNKPYPFLNNPSNPYGEGFISTYDTKKERFIITKKDFYLNPTLTELEDYEICVGPNGEITIFENFSQTIQTYEDMGYEYVGIEDCQMKFQKTEYEEVEEERQITVTVPNTADIHVFYDTSGSFTPTELNQVKDAVAQWVTNFGAANPDWVGTLYEYNDGTENWLDYAAQIAATTYGGVTNDKDVIVISFCNESQGSQGGGEYHDGTLDNPMNAPTGHYAGHYNNFVLNVYPSYNSFLGIHYPVVFSNLESSKNFLLHSMAAVFGTELTPAEVAALTPNPGMTAGEWGILTNDLTTNNTYSSLGPGLDQYGWTGRWDRFADNGQVITPQQFQNDITELLEGAITQEIITVTVLSPYTEYEYVPGVPLEGELLEYNNSWTLSYSLKNNSWISWHSYMPNFYYYVSEKFFSWIFGNNGMWKHNRKGHYQTFYGKYHPHVLEYVSLSSPITTRIWNHLRLITEAKRYNNITKEYVDERFITHNKAVLYNSRQCSGLMELNVKDPSESNYLMHQVVNNNNNTYQIDRNERDWTINDLRDIRVDYTDSIWDSSISSVQNEYYIDKVLNTNTLDINKDWTQLESFRDKYLVIRLIFDKFANIKLLTNYSVENEQQSFR